jgi:hypothetical protein
LHAALPLVPLWLDEGLAEYYEVAAAKRAYDNEYLGTLRWSARLGVVPSLEKLEKKEDLEETGRSDYRNAWAWVHFLLHGSPEGREELIQYLADLQKGGSPGAMSDRLRRRLPLLEDQFTNHYRSWRKPPAIAARPQTVAPTPVLLNR